MKYYGIFNFSNGVYTLLRYSDIEQTSRNYFKLDIDTKIYNPINEVCLPEINYSSSNIGKQYDPSTGIFS